MNITKIIEASECRFMDPETFREAMNKLAMAKSLAELVCQDYEDAADWKDAKPKLTKLAERILL